MAQSIDPGLMINNVAGLAQAAKSLGVPPILTTIGAKGSTAGLVLMPTWAAPAKAGSRRAPTDGQTKTAATDSEQRI